MNAIISPTNSNVTPNQEILCFQSPRDLQAPKILCIQSNSIKNHDSLYSIGFNQKHKALQVIIFNKVSLFSAWSGSKYTRIVLEFHKLNFTSKSSQGYTRLQCPCWISSGFPKDTCRHHQCHSAHPPLLLCRQWSTHFSG